MAPTISPTLRSRPKPTVRGVDFPALSDDTGLEVDALGGAPGVFSARYAGEGASYADNVAKLLAALAEYEEPSKRRARFVTVIVVCDGERVLVSSRRHLRR